MRSERVAWVVLFSVLLIAVPGSALISVLPEPMRQFGWVLLGLFEAFVVLGGFLWARRGKQSSAGRHA